MCACVLSPQGFKGLFDYSDKHILKGSSNCFFSFFAAGLCWFHTLRVIHTVCAGNIINDRQYLEPLKPLHTEAQMPSSLFVCRSAEPLVNHAAQIAEYYHHYDGQPQIACWQSLLTLILWQYKWPFQSKQTSPKGHAIIWMNSPGQQRPIRTLDTFLWWHCISWLSPLYFTQHYTGIVKTGIVGTVSPNQAITSSVTNCFWTKLIVYYLWYICGLVSVGINWQMLNTLGDDMLKKC